MRLSEKTIEINWCAQFAKACPCSVLWFGLTQKQEAMAGFDVCTKVGGRLLIFQFKASDRVLRSGARQFQLKHDQLIRLQNRVNHFQRSVFYVFPSIGSTSEVVTNPNVLAQSQLLDVARIPTLLPPTKSDGTHRKTGVHYADVESGVVTLHSDPVELQLVKSIEFVEAGFPGADGFNWAFEDFDSFWEFRRTLLTTSMAVVIAAAGKSLGEV